MPVSDPLRALPVLAWLLVLATAPAGAGPRPELLTDPEARANALKQVSQRLICQCSCNMILAECSHQTCPFALPEREKIVAALAAGQSDDEIIAAYVAKFGPGIRATPPTEGSLYDRVAWYLPAAGLAIGLGIVAVFLARFTGRRAAGATNPIVPPAGPDDPYRRRVEMDVSVGESGGPAR